MEPTWKIGQLFNFDVVQYALNTDGIFSHVSMTSTVNSPEEIESKFDDISYEKGMVPTSLPIPCHEKISIIQCFILKQ